MLYVLCSECDRHVLRGTSACPFCGGTTLVAPRAATGLLLAGALALSGCDKDKDVAPADATTQANASDEGGASDEPRPDAGNNVEGEQEVEVVPSVYAGPPPEPRLPEPEPKPESRVEKPETVEEAGMAKPEK